MRLAVFSDIHGNLVALEAVLRDLTAAGGADRVVLAGDLCLDGPQPAAVVDLARASQWTVLMGNTDRDLWALRTPEAARAAEKDWQLIEWTQGQLGEERLAYLQSLAFAERPLPAGATGEREMLLIVHANPRDLDAKLWPGTPADEVARLLGETNERTIVHGHVHIQSVRHVGSWRLVNVGSVGQPKDGDHRAAYALFTWRHGRWEVEPRRVVYDLEAAEQAIRSCGMPEPVKQIETLRQASYGSQPAGMRQGRGERLEWPYDRAGTA